MTRLTRAATATLIAAAAAVSLAACGSEEEPAAPEPAPTTAAATTTEPAPAATTSAPAPAPAPAPATVIVPDGVGKNYQLAQDLWRNAGLAVMPAEDALGLDRIPFDDENWVVVSQDPAAGTQVETASPITATIQKYTD